MTGRPNGRVDATLRCNEDAIARARDRQREELQADQDLRRAKRDLGDAEHHVIRAEARIYKLHRDDEDTCRRLRHENEAMKASA